MIRFEYGRTGTRRVLSLSNDELIVRPIQDEEEYIAISHTWGPTINTLPGIEWNVASWLSHQTCRALIEAFNTVWIDSLCIKQNDKRDKEEQIKDMRNIYRDAADVVVVLTGNYQAQLNALRRTNQLLENLKAVGNCTSSPDCPYVKTMEEMRDAAITVRELQWWRRVWTLQETIIPIFLTFVGLEGGILHSNVTTEEELRGFIHAYDDVSDVKSEAWSGSITHPCTMNRIDPMYVAKDIGDIVNFIRPTNLMWYKHMSGKDVALFLEIALDTVSKQLGNNDRQCKEPNDLVYGVCALLEIEMNVDYGRRFEDVFFEALKQLVRRGICVLPQRPQLLHRNTWLPSLEHIHLEDAWKTVKSSYVLSEELNMYHKIVCKGTSVFARGTLIQFCHPYILRTGMEGLVHTLEAVVSCVRDGEDFNADTMDRGLLIITCAVLWMSTYRGNDHRVTIKTIDSLIHLFYNHVQMQLSEMLRPLAPHITYTLNLFNNSISQTVKDILQYCLLVPEDISVYKSVPWHNRDAILVCKKRSGFVLYGAPSSIQVSNTYGIFYKPSLRSEVREIYCNILARNDDGIWDNHGGVLCWYITRSWNICKRNVLVGTID